MRSYYVYIVSSRTKVLYTGVTNDLQRRVYEHREGLVPGFTQQYKVKRLVYFESFDDIREAIAREKEIKGWRRSKKLDLIDDMNPEWDDLSEEMG